MPSRIGTAILRSAIIEVIGATYPITLLVPKILARCYYEIWESLITKMIPLQTPCSGGAIASMKPNTAFLLSQVGAHSAGMFVTLLAPLDMSPPHFGIVWMLSRSPGLSQRQMAARLQVHPSRLVALLDQLETRRLIERRGHKQDRRLHALHLTAQGQDLLRDITRIAEQHLKLICAALTAKECEQLTGFLQRIADQQKLTPAVHPGYRWLGRKIRQRSA